jgi:putative membrane protein
VTDPLARMPASPTRADPTSNEVARSWPSDASRWHRLHPLSPVVRTGRALYALVFLLVVAIGHESETAQGSRFVVDIAIAAVLVMAGVVSWLVTRWRLEEGTLRIETGLIRRSSQRFPLVQIQAIDTVRPLLARVFGLAELRLRMAGHSGTSGRLAYLTESQADLLRARLLALAHGIAEDTPAPPERILFSVPTGRLIGSILLSPYGLAVILVAAVLLSISLLAPAAAGVSIGGPAVTIIVLMTALWRQFNGDFELTVSNAHDGLHLRAGLLTTNAETIPQGRVQAVRMVEPLLWRPLGWCRMHVDVAGRHRQQGESDVESRELRAVLPVGTREEARRLLEHIVPDAPPDRIPPPSRARLKTPLRYHYLSWGRNETCLVTTSGRVARITDWVPHAKVQSLRWVQGPVQRRLRLATIHVDTAGRNVHAAISDRDTGEVDRILPGLIASCRAARRSSDGTRSRAVPHPSGTSSRTWTTRHLTVPIPPRPDIASPTPEARWHWSGLEIALAAPLGWLGGSWVAWRSLGWYPLSSAKVFFVVGWVPVLFVGLTVGLARSALRRRTVGALLMAIAFATPVLAAHHLPGVKQPTQYPIPGRPWLAISAAPGGASDLYLMKGDADHLLSFGETPWTEGSAALSPDHRHIAFASNRYGNYDLFVMDLDANGNRIRTRRLTDGPGDESEAAWSPDGRRIVYTVRRGRSSTIHVIEASGGTPRAVAGSAVNPEWSPDGHWIAYSAPDPSNRTDYDIWVMRPDGSHPRDVIDATPTDWSPRWSPDGSRIAFTGGRDDHWGVYLADTNGARVQGVMGGSETNEAFGWSPDGSKILFLSDRSHTGGTFLYFMDLDGTNVQLALRL